MLASELVELGFEKEVRLFLDEVQKIRDKNEFETARSFAMLGATVNYSYWEKEHNREIDEKTINQAFRNLGVKKKIKGRKWYQFWLNNSEQLMINKFKALQQLTQNKEGK